MRAFAALLTVALGATVACTDATAPIDHLRVDATVLTPVIVPNGTAQVRVTATNPTASPISITTGGCPFDIRIYDAADREVGFLGGSCIAVLVNRRIPPFGSFSQVVEWTASVSTPGGIAPAPVGEYTVRGVLMAQEGDEWSSPQPLRISEVVTGGN